MVSTFLYQIADSRILFSRYTRGGTTDADKSHDAGNTGSQAPRLYKVYQDGERLLWLIGKEIDKNTEVIYHIHTDEPEKLPEKRIQYGFDNRGFRVCAEQAENEFEGIEHYRVFEKEIPGNYHVTAIVVGFNTDGTITWTDSFRLH